MGVINTPTPVVLNLKHEAKDFPETSPLGARLMSQLSRIRQSDMLHYTRTNQKNQIPFITTY